MVPTTFWLNGKLKEKQFLKKDLNLLNVFLLRLGVTQAVVVADTCTPGTEEAETGRSPKVRAQSGLQSEILSQAKPAMGA